VSGIDRFWAIGILTGLRSLEMAARRAGDFEEAVKLQRWADEMAEVLEIDA